MSTQEASGTRIHTFPSTADTLTRRRPHTTKTRYENLIINTLLKAKSKGLTKNTLKSISYSLKQISKTADLNNPEEVKMSIANMNVANSTKQKHINNYAYYCTANEIEWNRPSYKWDRKIPLIPTTENINKIICVIKKIRNNLHNLNTNWFRRNGTSNNTQKTNRRRKRNHQRTRMQRTQLTLT